MTLETLIAQLKEAKSKKLIHKATVSTVWLPASVVIQLPHTTTEETLDKLREFFKATFPHTELHLWEYHYTQEDLTVICMSLTVDYMHLLQGEVPRGETPLEI